jgi:type II secretory pathway predicted ATPase ExeA
MIFSFEMDSKDRAVILLAGLPTLNNTMRLVAHEPLRQRITMNYHMEGLNKEEAKNYIQEKLRLCKAHPGIFSESAIEAIVNTAGGVPRIINKLCDASLVIGHNKNASEINQDIVMLSISETELG